MVTDELTDGKRIGELLASEIHGRERGVLGGLGVVEANEDVEPAEDGAFAFAIAAENGERIAGVYVHPDRLHLEFDRDRETAAEAGRKRSLNVRVETDDSPRTLVFVENGAEVKPVLGVVRTVAKKRIDDRG